MRAQLVVVLICSLPLAACGDDATGTGGGGSGGAGTGGAAAGATSTSGGTTDGAWAAYCEALVAREEGCDPNNPPSPTLQACLGAEACFGNIVREEAREALRDCLVSRPCDDSDDACFAQVAATQTPVTGQDAYISACSTKLDGCVGDFSDDYCTPGDLPLGVFPAELYVELTPCFEEACEDVGDCLDAALVATGAACGGEYGI